MGRLVGTTLIDRYRIDALVAIGGFGAIFRATHLPTGCDVAIKVLHDELAHDAGIRERFRREAATVKLLRAPNTVATYELGETAEGRLFIAMEWLRGESLIDVLDRERALPWRQAVAIARAVCAALSEAHELGIVHRDLKPANIHLEPWSDDGFVKVLDFGIAKIVRSGLRTRSIPGIEDEELTQAGEVLGTLEYMAPEQIVGSAIDARTDIYALGIVLYEMLAGVRPFEHARDATALIGTMLSERPQSLSQHLTAEPVPAALDAIVMRCLAPRRRDRFASVDELATALDALERAADILEPARRKSLWTIAPTTLVEQPVGRDVGLLATAPVATRQPREVACELGAMSMSFSIPPTAEVLSRSVPTTRGRRAAKARELAARDGAAALAAVDGDISMSRDQLVAMSLGEITAALSGELPVQLARGSSTSLGDADLAAMSGALSRGEIETAMLCDSCAPAVESVAPRAARGSVLPLQTLDVAMIAGLAPRDVPAPLPPASAPTSSLAPRMATPPSGSLASAARSQPITATSHVTIPTTNWSIVFAAAVVSSLVTVGAAFAML